MQNWVRLSAASRCLTKCGKSTNSIEWDCARITKDCQGAELGRDVLLLSSKPRGSSLTVQEDFKLTKKHNYDDNSEA